jgi:hypothetical protein
VGHLSKAAAEEWAARGARMAYKGGGGYASRCAVRAAGPAAGTLLLLAVLPPLHPPLLPGSLG